MEITVGLFLLLLSLAFFCEFVDASLGMGYGTILAPALLIIGFEPSIAVPAVLISQAFGGFCASVFHHQFENVSFNMDSQDFRLALIIGGLGVFATTVAALISLRLPEYLLKTYIGLLVLTMGVLLLRNRRFEFSWKKLVAIGILSAFNKGISGGGFGPIVTGGQILAGQKHKTAIGVTTLAEAPICITGFFTYLIARTVQEVDAPVLDNAVGDVSQANVRPRDVPMGVDSGLTTRLDFGSAFWSFYHENAGQQQASLSGRRSYRHFRRLDPAPGMDLLETFLKHYW